MERDPCYAWRAYAEARGAKLPVPQWVHDYLDYVWRNLQFLHLVPPRKKQIDHAIAEAVGFGRGGVTIREFKNGFEDPADAVYPHLLRPRGGNPFKKPDQFAFAVQVYDYLLNGHKETHAIEYVAKKRRASVSSVRRAWKAYAVCFDIPASFTK